jgi:hypothetical protein
VSVCILIGHRTHRYSGVLLVAVTDPNRIYFDRRQATATVVGVKVKDEFKWCAWSTAKAREDREIRVHRGPEVNGGASREVESSSGRHANPLFGTEGCQWQLWWPGKRSLALLLSPREHAPDTIKEGG